MDERKRDKHLNLYHFFSDNNSQYHEDNLTRGLGLCLRQDPVLLDRLLRNLLPEEKYSELFNSEDAENSIWINLQEPLANFDGDIDYLLGVAMSVQDLDSNGKVEPRSGENPITDLVIQINNTLIIFEVKRTNENCLAQLEQQLHVIQKTVGLQEHKVERKSFSWRNLMGLINNLMSFQSQTQTVNRFTADFRDFIEARHADWFPIKRLNNIHFPSQLDDDNPDYVYLTRRLTQIKQEMGLGGEELSYDRKAIPVDYGWANEINLAPKEDGQKYLALRMWPGDTKTQGNKLFKKGKKHVWPEQINGYPFQYSPYLKFGHFSKGICRLWFGRGASPGTHTYDFFNEYAGRWKREQWEAVDEALAEIEPGWKQQSGWKSHFEDSDRSYSTLSIGYAIEVLIPYEEARTMEGSGEEPPQLAVKLRETALELRTYIDDRLNQ